MYGSSLGARAVLSPGHPRPGGLQMMGHVILLHPSKGIIHRTLSSFQRTFSSCQSRNRTEIRLDFTDEI
jgi:hypothetical protein